MQNQASTKNIFGSAPPAAISGAAMDLVVPRRHGKTIALAAAALLLVAAGAVALWWWMPRGVLVAAAELRLATVEKGIFLDDVALRASAEPFQSVMLDSVESGRVEEVLAADGALVTKGQLLFRLSNPQRNLELLARQAEHAQQISNLSNLRVAQEAARSEHRRRLSELEFALLQGDKRQRRNLRLAAQGFISAVALEESADQLEQQRRALAEERAGRGAEERVRDTALAQLDQAIGGLSSGLQLVGATVEALAVRAPVAGRLTDFRLQVGESIVTGRHLGRIDDPRRFKLSALVDEFYLNRVAVGRRGLVQQDGRDYALAVSAVYPQIKDGRFTLELRFDGQQPPLLSPGQSLDARLTLGQPAPALLLPNGAFLNDSGGAWVFVLDGGGRHAVRREIRVGRRNNSQVELLAGLQAGERVIVSSYATFAKAPRLQLED